MPLFIFNDSVPKACQYIFVFTSFLLVINVVIIWWCTANWIHGNRTFLIYIQINSTDQTLFSIILFEAYLVHQTYEIIEKVRINVFYFFKNTVTENFDCLEKYDN